MQLTTDGKVWQSPQLAEPVRTSSINAAGVVDALKAMTAQADKHIIVKESPVSGLLLFSLIFVLVLQICKLLVCYFERVIPLKVSMPLSSSHTDQHLKKPKNVEMLFCFHFLKVCFLLLFSSNDRV